MKIGLIRASLPSYFPEKHGVWEAAETALAALCDSEGVTLYVAQDIPMDSPQTKKVLESYLQS